MSREPRDPGHQELLFGMFVGVFLAAFGLWLILLSPDANAWADYIQSARTLPGSLFAMK